VGRMGGSPWVKIWEGKICSNLGEVVLRLTCFLVSGDICRGGLWNLKEGGALFSLGEDRNASMTGNRGVGKGLRYLGFEDRRDECKGEKGGRTKDPLHTWNCDKKEGCVDAEAAS